MNEQLSRACVFVETNWKCEALPDGDYMGVCEELQLSLISDSKEHLFEDMKFAVNSIVNCYITTNELLDVAKERRWRVVVVPDNLPQQEKFELIAGENNEFQYFHNVSYREPVCA
jgi:hypothetical protein